ncbi:MAG TPA: hypothetical protein VKE98_08790 [Gemmataceae bacterium]|nr:hypothetical protein [Gemmataceae bacterium]
MDKSGLPIWAGRFRFSSSCSSSQKVKKHGLITKGTANSTAIGGGIGGPQVLLAVVGGEA